MWCCNFYTHFHTWINCFTFLEKECREKLTLLCVFSAAEKKQMKTRKFGKGINENSEGMRICAKNGNNNC